MNFHIEPYTEKDRADLLIVWEKSVLATHIFLKPLDFEEIRGFLYSMDFSQFEVHCLWDSKSLIGFIGIDGAKIEMLFLHPDYIGQGLGKRLLQFACSSLNATCVDVNEQNKSAYEFYLNFGFKTFERTEKDDLGKDYPLLRMKL